jgi:endonuclease/exonuclease/phosphatase family metal-dependent hydrolase
LDSYVIANHITEHEEGLPLTTSHFIQRKGNVRYDFLFVKSDFKIERMEYQFHEAIAAGSDHALLLCDVAV